MLALKPLKLTLNQDKRALKKQSPLKIIIIPGFRKRLERMILSQFVDRIQPVATIEVDLEFARLSKNTYPRYVPE